MIKITFDNGGTIQRETEAVYKTRPVCVSLMRHGVKVWLKGKRDSYVIPYEQLFMDGERGSVSIAGRKVSEAALAKIAARREAGA